MRQCESIDSLLLPPLTKIELNKRLIRVGLITVLISGAALFLIYISGAFTKGQDLRELARSQALEYYSRTHRVEHYKPAGILHSKQNAVIVILCRNEDLDSLLSSLRNFEFQFNRQFKYPYVLLNNVPFEEKFKNVVKRMIAGLSNASVEFGLIPREHWSYPSWINQAEAAIQRDLLHQEGVIYGGSESYRHMCRYFSGFLHHHPLMAKYEYYWRVEPGVSFLCNIPFDPFEMMKRHNKSYGFVIAFGELARTIPSLWQSTREFMETRKDLLREKNPCFPFFLNQYKEFNYCHFWSNFEIGSLAFFRSSEYQAYFDFLDKKGGFFYERWGDAPVHSLAVGMFLRKDQVAYFEDIGYRHAPFSHCPVDGLWRRDHNCLCNPFTETDMTHSECQLWWNKLEMPEESLIETAEFD